MPNVDYERRSVGIQIDGGSGADNRFFVDGSIARICCWGLRCLSTSSARRSRQISSNRCKSTKVVTTPNSALPSAASSAPSPARKVTPGAACWGDTTRRTASRAPCGRCSSCSRPTRRPPNTSRSRAIGRSNASGSSNSVDRRSRSPLAVLYFRQPGRRHPRSSATFQSNGLRGTFEWKPVGSLRYVQPERRAHVVVARASGSLARSSDTRCRSAGHSDRRVPSTSNPALFPDPRGRASFQNSLSGTMDWTWSNKPSLTCPRTRSGTADMTRNTQRRCGALFRGSNRQFTDIPANLHHVSGFRDANPSARIVRDNYERFAISADATRYATWHGAHRLKTGVQFERVGNDVLWALRLP